MKPLTQTLKKMLTALAAADAGEMLGRRAKARYLNDLNGDTPQARPQAQATPPAMPKRKQVALWLADMPSQAALNYALSSCQRMDMDLVILHGGKLRAQALLAAHGDAFETAGVITDIQAIDGTEQNALFKYIERHSRIAFLVMDDASQSALSQAAMPPVPLVVVSTVQAAAETEPKQVVAA